MSAARRPLALACILLFAACTPIGVGGGIRDAALPPTISTHFAGMMTLEDSAEFRAAAAARGFLTTPDGVVLDIQTQGLTADDRDAFDLPGLTLRSFHPQYERVSAVAARPELLHVLAGLPFVRMVAPAFPATTGGY